MSGLLASFGRKTAPKDLNRMPLKAAESAPLPEGALPIGELSPVDSPPELEDSAFEEDVEDPISLDMANIDFLSLGAEGAPESSVMQAEDERPSIGPLVNLADGIPEIHLPDLADVPDLPELQGLDPFTEGVIHEDEPMPEIPDLPLPDLDSTVGMDDPFSSLGEDIFADDLIEDMDELDPGMLAPDLSARLDDWDGQGHTQELGDLSLDEGLDLDFEEEALRPALLEEELFSAGDLFGELPGDVEQEELTSKLPPSSGPAPAGKTKKSRGPARLKMAYHSPKAFVREYRENLESGSTFIKTSKPLREGRECVLEVRAPSLPDPITLTGVVTWSSRKRQLAASEEPGMSIEYRLVGEQRESLLRALKALDKR